MPDGREGLGDLDALLPLSTFITKDDTFSNADMITEIPVREGLYEYEVPGQKVGT